MSDYLYIIFSKKIDRYYVGVTTDIDKRLKFHREGKGGGKRSFTKRAEDWLLVYSEEYKTRSEALKREKEIKSKKSRIFIEKLVSVGQ